MILHYDGNSWTPMTSGSSAVLQAVWGSGETDVFAVGYDSSYAGVILHYDGNSWSSMSTGTASELYGVWGSGGADVFAVGRSKILHYDGNSWTAMNSGTSASFLAVWGTSGTDVFVTGADGKILHYDGSGWANTNIFTTNHALGIWGSSGTDVFAAVWDEGIRHYDGSAWAPMRTDTSLLGVWGSSATDVFAVGLRGMTKRFDGTTWSTMASPHWKDLKSVWGVSATDVFAVGAEGKILRYDGESWSYVDSGTPWILNDVWGSSGREVFAVSDVGTIRHFNGTAWAAQSVNNTSRLRRLWGSSGADMFAVGDNGTILHYDGTAWSAMASGTTGTIYGIWGTSGQDVYATGYSASTLQGFVLHYDGASWSLVVTVAYNHLYGVWGSSARDVYVVGDAGAILHYDGTAWSSMSSGTTLALFDVWGSSRVDVHAVGMYGVILHGLGVNRPPVSSGSSLLTPQDNATQATLSATDEDGDALTFEILTPPVHGAVSGAAPDLTYTPDMHYAGTDSFTFKANDGVADSNVATVNIMVTADTTRPTGSVVINNGAFSTTSAAVILQLVAADTGGSGFDVMRFVNGGGTPSSWEPCQAVKAWTLTGGAGTKTVYVQFRDKAGNVSDADPVKAGAQPYKDDIVCDPIPPTGTISINNGALYTKTAAVTLNLSAVDTGGSGLEGMRFTNSGGTASAWEPFATTKAWTLSGGPGTKTVYVQFKDKAGNISDADPVKAGAQSYKDDIVYDPIPPTGTISISGGGTSTTTLAVTLNLTAADTVGSGLDAMRLVNSGGTPSDWEPFQATKPWTLPGGAGTKTVYVQFRDKAGNISDADPIKAGAQSYRDTIEYTGP